MSNSIPNNAPDVLFQRYASSVMREVWSPHNRVIKERELWLSVLRAQQKLGLPITDSVIEAYEQVKQQVDLDSIRQRESVNRHDIKARIEEFNALANASSLHLGLTSRDISDNVDLLLLRQSLDYLSLKSLAVLNALADKMLRHKSLIVVARTHFVPAQTSTLGRRWAMHAEELLLAWQAADDFRINLPLRGIKGAIGHQSDQCRLLGTGELAEQLDQLIAQELGFKNVLLASGQIYPRSIDADFAARISRLAASISSIAVDIRLMTGLGLLHEGFGKEQTGSSAMPHKKNARSSERINGLYCIIEGYHAMLSRLSGNQWNEGDVVCSVVRRVALPGLCAAYDGLLEAMLTVFTEMEIFNNRFVKEVEQYLPFLASTALLMEAVKLGSDREDIHRILRQHMQSPDDTQLIDNLALDPDFPLSKAQILTILEQVKTEVGNAQTQVETLAERIANLLNQHEGAKSIKPEKLL